MAHVTSFDGVKLYFEARGAGTPVVFVHEFAGSCRSFDLQVDAFESRHRCVGFNARGYPPSDIPQAVDAYSQDNAARDILAVLDGLNIERGHLLGVSMGAAAVLQVAIKQPARVLSAILVSIGSGSDARREEHESSMEAMARLIDTQGIAGLAARVQDSPGRRKLKEENPAEFQRFVEQVNALSALGTANTMRGVQKRRPPLYAHEKELASAQMPVLVVLGGDDAACRGPSEFLNRTLHSARLEVFPGAGHLVNIEEPVRFNRLCLDFLGGVDARTRNG